VSDDTSPVIYTSMCSWLP